MMKTNPQTKRAHWHDYRSSFRYLITLSKSWDIPPFSQIDGDWRLPVGTRGSAYTRWSPTGRVIADRLYHIGDIHPALRTEQYIVMPDHVHVLLSVQSKLPEHLGFYIARFKNSINTATSKNHIFEDGFNDQIVTNKRDLNTIFNYIRSNPYRLAVRCANPDFFTRCNSLSIGSHTCRAYGNIHLLTNPFKDQVIVHRADKPDLLSKHKDEWLYTAANGGVLVSPFISPAEKAIRTEAEALGSKIILITHETLPERFKPAARDFSLCTEGRLLIISLGLPENTPLSRALCVEMNALAQAIVTPKSTPLQNI